MSDMFTIVLLLLMLGCGGFSVYTAIKVKVKGYLFPSKMLYPGNCSPSDCTDAVGFITYIFPRLLIFGILCIVIGVAVALDEYIGLGVPEWVSLYVIPFTGLPVFIWYIIVQNKASKLFW